MTTKALIIISTAEKEKALTGILYATNVIKHGWLDEVQVFFFGPFESLLANDKQVQEKVQVLQQLHNPTACKFLSEQSGVTSELVSLGYEVEYIGSMISEAIKEGYAPMIF